MQLTVQIVRFNTSFRSRVNFYSVLLPNEVEHETKKFFLRFQAAEFEPHIREMRALIQGIGIRGQALPRLFRKEGNAYAMPGYDYARPKFRLYLVLCCPTVLILGSGGVKESRFNEDSPDCYPHYKLMDAIGLAFKEQGIDCCSLPALPSPFPLTITLDNPTEDNGVS